MPRRKWFAVLFNTIVFFQLYQFSMLAQQPITGNVRISMGYDGSQANGDSYNPTISNNGRFVVFTSDATNLVPYDTNGKSDVFVFDLETEIMERVSVASNGVQGNDHSGGDFLANISNDGRYVVFSSVATNLVKNDANNDCERSYWNENDEWVTVTYNCPDVFLKDRLTNETQLISVSSAGVQGNGASVMPTISGDGRYVAFVSWANNLVVDDNNSMADIFVRDLLLNETRRVSLATGGRESNGLSFVNKISENGCCVVFETFANNLVPEDTDDQLDVYVHDLQTKETSYVSAGFSSNLFDRFSLWPDISADGRWVSFQSGLTGGNGGATQIYRRDRQNGVTEIVSTSSDGHQGNKDATWSSISDTGRWIAFVSEADNLVDVGGQVCADCGNIFLKDMETGEVTLISRSTNGNYASESDKYSAIVSVSGDGSRVVYHSTSNALIVGDTNGHKDVFVYGWKTTPLYTVNLPVVMKSAR